MVESGVPHDVLLSRLHQLADQSLQLWGIPDNATARLINVSENTTYLVEAPDGSRSVLRIHRENYHSKRAIQCELAWMQALSEDNCVVTPAVIPGQDGEAVQTARSEDLENPRHMVMFEFVPGEQPDENHDLVTSFEELGEMAARTHEHSIRWQRPQPFERLVWNLDAFYGADATWGNWREGPNLTEGAHEVLERVEATVKRRIQAFGDGPQQYGLIHADMRLANLLVDRGTTRLIDFDDCGMGWFLYDFAAGISFIEDRPEIPDMRKAWVAGYRKVRNLSEEEEREIDSFIMLRRMALLAWIASHIDVPEAQELAPDFARVSAELGEAYLSLRG
ncbi:phosphotransferase enzyme family protein [Fodinicurvata fenggangensis]|uniref:phosphotransferase enzyme family protein n=1 Tax=Fodinicurvata fenggangensis TaxID=1121830 RepID=UPI00047B79B8|nr:phosphotransferase [Fodinicurvata fenggangensis]